MGDGGRMRVVPLRHVGGRGVSKRSGPTPQRLRPLGPEAFAKVVTFCPEAFVAVDAGGIVTEWNPRAHADFGWRRDEIVGQRADETIIGGGSIRATSAVDPGEGFNGNGYGNGSGNGNGGGVGNDGGAVARSDAHARLLAMVTASWEQVATEALVFALGPAQEGSRRGWGAFLRRLDGAETTAR